MTQSARHDMRPANSAKLAQSKPNLPTFRAESIARLALVQLDRMLVDRFQTQ
jgi:hypothetical protein